MPWGGLEERKLAKTTKVVIFVWVSEVSGPLSKHALGQGHLLKI